MNERADFPWHLGRLPFIWRPLPTPANLAGLPDSLPFALTIDEVTGRLCQAPDGTVSDALRQAYAVGSEITGMMDEVGIGRRYADDFLAFLDRRLGSAAYAGMRILEIGCGNGYLLHRLRQLGASVMGVEPGSQGAAGATRYDVDIVHDYFPTPAVSGRFDLVILYCVLEHLEDPAQLFDQIAPHLATQGRVALAVPDCTPYVEHGDLSMLFHEHWSYFDLPTLGALLQYCGLGESHIESAGFGGLLYAFAQEGAPAGAHAADFAGRCQRAARYRALASPMLDRLRKIVESVAGAGRSIGIYVPSRAVNALSLIGAPPRGLRFFDDNPTLQGTYFPGITVPVEPRACLLANPTDDLLIFSHTFGERLRSELTPRLPATRVITWNELFHVAAG